MLQCWRVHSLAGVKSFWLSFLVLSLQSQLQSSHLPQQVQRYVTHEDRINSFTAFISMTLRLCYTKSLHVVPLINKQTFVSSVWCSSLRLQFDIRTLFFKLIYWRGKLISVYDVQGFEKSQLIPRPAVVRCAAYTGVMWEWSFQWNRKHLSAF